MSALGRTTRAFPAALVLIVVVLGSQAQAQVTIFPAEPQLSTNCIPFGRGQNFVAAFVYQNVPAFTLGVGDIIAFDLSSVNDTNIELEIALAATTVNGGDVQAAPFLTVVSNTQTATNPVGDSIVGNFELQWLSEAAFSFAGGGLIVRFSNPSAAYLADNTCDLTLVSTSPSDTSGFFVQRMFNDLDGVAPWDNVDPNFIGSVQFINVQDAFEPDDDTTQATMIAPGDRQSHNIAPVGDVDFVTFTLSESSGIVLETSGSTGSTELRLFDEPLNQVALDFNSGEGSFSRIELSCRDALPPGTYFAEVRESGNDAVVDYELSFDAFACGSDTPVDVAWIELGNPTSDLGRLPILRAGHVPARVSSLAFVSSIFEVLWILNPDPAGYDAELSSNVDAVASYVTFGGTLLFHDSYVARAAEVLPGAEAFTFVATDALPGAGEVGIFTGGTALTQGPGGRLNQTSLDSATAVSQGYLLATSLPFGSAAMLARETGLEVVDFTYGSGLGEVHYSSLPLGMFLADPSRPAAIDTYAVNVLAYAANVPDVMLYFNEDSNSMGLYRLDPLTGAATNIGDNGVTVLTVGLAPSNTASLLFGSEPFGLTRVLLDGDPIQGVGSLRMEGMAYDAATGTLYGAINGDLFTVNIGSGGIAVDLANPSADVEALAFGNGLLFGLADGRSEIQVYDPVADSWSMQGDTGITWTDPGLAFDSTRNLLYAKGSQDSNLYSIDPSNGTTTPLGDTGIAAGGGLAVVVIRTPTGTLYLSEGGNTNGLYRIDPRTAGARSLGSSGGVLDSLGLSPSSNSSSLFGSQPFGLLDIPADGSGASMMAGTTAIEGLAYDVASQTLYGVTNGDLFTLDPSDGSRVSDLADSANDIEGIAFGNGGVYGLADGGNLLEFYDPSVDQWFTVGDTFIASWDDAGLAYDPVRNILWAKRDGDPNLWAINESTGEAFFAGATSVGSGGGLAFVPATLAPEPASGLLGCAALATLGVLARGRRRRA